MTAMDDQYEPIAAQQRAASLYEQARYCHEVGRRCLAGMLQRMAARQSATARALAVVPTSQNLRQIKKEQRTIAYFYKVARDWHDLGCEEIAKAAQRIAKERREKLLNCG